jgi:hypothetical protein
MSFHFHSSWYILSLDDNPHMGGRQNTSKRIERIPRIHKTNEISPTSQNLVDTSARCFLKKETIAILF